MEMDDDRLGALPQEIMLNILSRLPAELVLDCKLTCRAWRDFIRFHVNTTYFADLHLRHQYGHGLMQKEQHKPFEHYHYHYGTDSETLSYMGFDIFNRALWYLEYYDDDRISTEKLPNYRIRKINITLPVAVCGGLVGSDNGLICLTVKTKYNSIRREARYISSPNEPLVICNPITREFVNLPRLLINEDRSIDGVHIVYGFGYHLMTNEYKVVRIWYAGIPNESSFKGYVEVYTLGNGRGWRNAGKTSYYLWPGHKYIGNPAGVCVNGALHWPCDESEEIVAFDLADEKFHLLHTPIDGHRIFVLRGCLCVGYFNNYSLELWLLKKDKEEDVSSSYQMNGRYYKSWSWNKELKVQSTMALSIRWSIFSLTKKGEILLTNGREVVCCTSNHQGTKESKRIMELNDCRITSYWNVPHINSFVSLEATGEGNIRKLVAERPSAKTVEKALSSTLF